MSQGYKICPICGTHAHRNATLCATCGTSLTDVDVVSESVKPANGKKPRYDRRYGETDLLEGDVHRRGGVYLFGGMLVLGAVACVAAIVFVGARWLLPSISPQPTETPSPVASPLPVILVTNTPAPSPVLATVTLPPPTATNTATPGPCTHKVQAGDDLISIAFECGHRSMDVIPLVLTLNNLSAPDMINVGQEIIVPWPTETPSPTSETTQGDTSSSDTGAGGSEMAAAPTDIAIQGLEIAAAPTRPPPTERPTPTLLPGVMWHTIQPNENIVSIAFEYHTDVQVLSQLNPEITFSQCDFGNPAGGPDCSVMVYAGQQMRVPAPTPTPTLSPTLSGSETALPTFTPTYNAPSALSPADRTLFLSDDLITLRWVGSGTLGANDLYRVRVEDLTTRAVYTSDTSDLSFIVPQDWQGQDGRRHEYRWMISVIRVDDPDRPYYTTKPRLFTWEGR
ncbi:MAG: LysM peptidoglycan-binding domain-containing protein [Anaerolineae bacterium]|nr:LysM peptidoglycan-binding domain-containing protein [Anaerolineae bacterium]